MGGGGGGARDYVRARTVTSAKALTAGVQGPGSSQRF